MNNFISTLKEYSSLLELCSVWQDSKDILAPVFTDAGDPLTADCYIYEFYCYISIIVDLKNNYEIKFMEGKGKTKHKFPQAAANKKDKPKFLAYKNEVLEFQICAGTKIDGMLESEENHPDISFQMPNSSDHPTHEDLIMIMDAKFKENIEESLPKAEVYKFGVIVDLFELRGSLKKSILFSKLKELEANCLITNGKSYSNHSDVKLLKKYSIKEVEKYYPNQNFNVIG